MQDTVDRVKENSVVVPPIVRPCVEGGYEIISDHRRKLASEQVSFTDMPCIIRNLNDDKIIIQFVERVLPRRRAKAHKMRLGTIKRQSAQTDLIASNNSA